MIKRIIRLSKGQELEIEMEPEFLNHVSRHFGIKTSQVNNEHIKQFIWRASKSALDKFDQQSTCAVAAE
jgi:hypothetical protein